MPAREVQVEKMPPPPALEQFPGHEEFSKEIRKMEAKGALD